jgi:hypothetical protein
VNIAGPGDDAPSAIGCPLLRTHSGAGTADGTVEACRILDGVLALSPSRLPLPAF